MAPVATPATVQGASLAPCRVLAGNTRARAVRPRSVRVLGSADSAEKILERASSASDGRAFRRSLNKTGRYIRKPVNDPDSLELMDEHGVGYSKYGLVARMRTTDYEFKMGDVRVKLAEAYGFCWGVERAVQMAYEARRAYPDKDIHVVNEIIHNPSVNGRLREMGFNIIIEENGKDFSGVKPGDVVVLPAFGATLEEMKQLNDMGCQLIDTTCPWVSKVWNAVDSQAKKKFTSIIHGKYAHEETKATASFAGDYLIVKNMNEANYVSDYILNGGDKAEFMEKFKYAMSEGFNPETMLDAVGIANQTTMLKGETEEVGKLFETTMMKKYGPAELSNHYLVMDTICDATQERQDAMQILVNQQHNPAERLDLMLVVGGFNSSNTSQLQLMAEQKGIPSFWVDGPACIDTEKNAITHRMYTHEMVDTNDWLPTGPITVGITSGASTPDSVVEDVLDKVFRIKDAGFTGVERLAAAVAVNTPDEDHED
mmetsp:Transcript_22887/g.40733  ORF Transcript_22887/g.40733 Transcript_22887/m.40733 type:complete len:485 (-) Transcript_22887:67-1521(-)|eukprot:CAMPEP_0177771850 /NCGR_PEP_ID=MMETSP0491_2-20121128/11862_1 /TAXON_ID=63592 /ORGANISM="Tetraselmis chuii, Strain PLY429" /LENGTH=484 /DNA_ID=CAMNT_0019289527 /DNA_START=147 /DNA_END=1601 /DNA_ORIENTATION=+